MEVACKHEVVALHQFFEDWFNGRLPRTDEVFARFASVLAPNFTIIQPNGRLTPRPPLLTGLWQAHGTLEATPGRIWIENPLFRPLSADWGLLVYEEWQTTPMKTIGFLSTALFQIDASAPNGVVWYHVHETWLPDGDR